MTDDQAKRDAIESVQVFLDVYKQLLIEKKYNGYDKLLMDNLKLVDASPNGAIWELEITEPWLNINGVVHGGAYGVIFDMCTAISMNPVSKDGYWDFLAGVSRTLNISYLKALPPGTTVRIKCEVIQHGKRMALIRGVMESVDGKTVFATAEHHKSAIPAQKEYVDRLRELREKRRRERSRI